MALRWLTLAVLVAGLLCAAAEAQDRAAQARLRTLFTVPGDWFVPKEVNPQDDKLRILLLVAGGPLLVEAQMTADGQPYSSFFEEQIDRLFKSADRDGDGKVTWEAEVVGMRLPGRRLSLAEKDKGVWLPALDLDADGIASRFELRRLLCLSGGGSPLVIGSQQGSPLTAEISFQQIADKDGNGVISADELDHLEKRLKMRDADDNELIDSYELLGAKVDAYQVTRKKSAAAIVLLTGETDWAALQQLVVAKYGSGKDSLGSGEPRLGELSKELDRDADSVLGAAELRGILTLEPQVRVEVNLGDSDTKPRGAFIKSVSDSIRRSAKISPLTEVKKQTLLEITGVRLGLLEFSALQVTPYGSLARSEMKRYDKDNNGYLDEKEAPPQFSLWDTDGDKKVYEKEIVAFYTDAAMLTRNRIYVAAVDELKEMFKLVDANSDGRLSSRELAEIKPRLLALDANKNGQLDPEEFPVTLRLTFSRGRDPNATFQGGRVFLNPSMVRMNSSPDWFTQMDANGDKDISPREFLGTPEQFETFDKNHDGMLSRVEVGLLMPP